MKDNDHSYVTAWSIIDWSILNWASVQNKSMVYIPTMHPYTTSVLDLILQIGNHNDFKSGFE